MFSFMNQKTEEGIGERLLMHMTFQGNKIILKLDCDNCIIPLIY